MGASKLSQLSNLDDQRIISAVAICTMFGTMFKFTSAEAAMVYTTKALASDKVSEASQILRYCYLLDFYTSIFAFSAVAFSSFFFPKLLNLASSTKWLLILFGFTVVFESTYWTERAILRQLDKFPWIFYQSTSISIIRTSVLALLFINKGTLTQVVFIYVGLSLIKGTSIFIATKIAMGTMGITLHKNTNRWWVVSKE